MAKSLRQAAKSFNSTRWDEAIKDDLFQIPAKATRVRLYDYIVTVRQHFVEFFSEKKKGNTGFYELCPNWDPTADDNNGAEVKGGCPICEQGSKYTEHLYAYLTPRKSAKGSATPVISIHPIRLTSKLGGDIVKLSEMVFPDEESFPEGWTDTDPPLASDQKAGFDIFLRKEEKAGNKTEYVPAHTDSMTPLTKAERQAFMEYIDEGHDVALLAKAGIRPRAEILQKLISLKVIEGPAKASRSYDNLDEQVPGEDDAAPPARSKVQAKKTEDEGDEAPPKKPAAKPAVRRSLPWDESEGGDEGEAEEPKRGNARHTAPPDEEDAPADDAEDTTADDEE